MIMIIPSDIFECLRYSQCVNRRPIFSFWSRSRVLLLLLCCGIGARAAQDYYTFPCSACDGKGTRPCFEYDRWINCEPCGGTGNIESIWTKDPEVVAAEAAMAANEVPSEIADIIVGYAFEYAYRCPTEAGVEQYMPKRYVCGLNTFNRIPDGCGTVKYTGGDVYVGEWRDDAYHGHLTYTYPDGTVQSGHYRDGAFVDLCTGGAGCQWDPDQAEGRRRRLEALTGRPTVTTASSYGGRRGPPSVRPGPDS